MRCGVVQGVASVPMEESGTRRLSTPPVCQQSLSPATIDCGILADEGVWRPAKGVFPLPAVTPPRKEEWPMQIQEAQMAQADGEDIDEE